MTTGRVPAPARKYLIPEVIGALWVGAAFETSDLQGHHPGSDRVLGGHG